MTGTLLLDGGTGSELRRRGVLFNEDVWSAAANIDQADVLTAIHRDFIDAGADIVTANTFASSRFVLDAAGLGDAFDAINRNAIDAAQRAAAGASRSVRVAASLSCCPPLLDRTAWPDAAIELEGYRELAALFADRGVDLILLEMLQHPDHAARACEAADESGLPYWAGLSCRLADAGAGGGAARLVAFDDPAIAFDAVLDAALGFEPAGIAIMHSPPEAVLPALQALRRRWSGPIGAWAELPYDEDPAVTVAERMTPEAYAERAREWLALGPVILGGCCGTTPAHIGALRRLLDEPAA